MGSPAQTGTKIDRESIRTFTFSERIKLWLISWAGFLLIRVIGATLRYELTTEPGCLTHELGAAPTSIWCFWHRCVIPAAYRFRKQKIAVMASRSFDGEYIARIIQKLGFIPVRGSSSRGGMAALLGMREQLEQGHPAVFTIDGPRGPRYVAKPGPVLLAKNTGVPIHRAIMAGERDTTKLANMCDRRVKASKETIIKALTGNYRADHLFTLKQALETYDFLHQQMQETLERCRLRAEAVFRQNQVG